MNIWIRNTDGKPDAVLTMTMMGFMTVLFKVMLSGVIIAGYTFGGIDAGTIAAIMTPTLGAYVARKYTDSKVEIAANAVASTPTFEEDGTVR